MSSATLDSSGSAVLLRTEGSGIVACTTTMAGAAADPGPTIYAVFTMTAPDVTEAAPSEMRDLARAAREAMSFADARRRWQSAGRRR